MKTIDMELFLKQLDERNSRFWVEQAGLRIENLDEHDLELGEEIAKLDKEKVNKLEAACEYFEYASRAALKEGPK